MNAFEEQDYNKRFDLRLWKSIFRYTGAYKKHLIGLAAVMVLVGGIDAAYPLLTRYAIDNFIVPGNLEGLWSYAAVYIGIIIMQGINIWVLIALSGRVETGLVYDIRRTGFKKLQELSFSYYDKTPVGWIMARMTSDAQRLGEVISWGLVDLTWGIAAMIISMAIMFSLNVHLALIALSVLPALAVISIYFQKKILKSYRSVRKLNSKITGAFNEGIMGAKTTKTLVREEQNLEEFRTITSGMRQSSVRAAIFSAVYFPIVTGLGGIGTGLALWYGGGITASGALSYGTLVAFIAYTVQFFEPVHQLARIFAEMQSAQASAERVLSMIVTRPEIEDSISVIERYGDVFNPIKENWPEIKGEVIFENVSFSYKDGEKVLDNFSLHVKPGETIALVGETGSGKSTIVNLICRFYEPTRGRILIDGVDYREHSQLWLQSNLGYVLQSPHLFSGTIMDNIRYGRLDASDAEVIEVAKLVNAHNFIERLDYGYYTEVGEGGSRLSTGEKQLISFARAIVANPRLFVLDEATSSIDTETEQIIQAAIQKVLDGRTSFIIAHRLSTIRSADRILIIVDGKVIEEGSHQQLLKERGYYYRLYTNQFVEEKENRIIYGLS